MENGSRHSDGQAGFAGTLRNIQLTDIIQMCCLAGASMTIRVEHADQSGVIHVVDGQLVHAACGRKVGEDAFFDILLWQAGRFETLDPQPVEEPSIQTNCQFLLMEAARRIDEQKAARPLEQHDEPQDEAGEVIRVLIVDDSAIMARILSSMLQADAGIDVVGVAKNGEQALEMIAALSPDLIVLDVNMPVMDGSTTLKHIMIQSPCPVVVMSNPAQGAYSTILEFLNLGAVDFMAKPVNDLNIVLQQQRMVQRIQMAATANVAKCKRVRLPKLPPQNRSERQRPDARQLIVLLSGTGGHLEMVRLMTSLSDDLDAGLVSMQSILPAFVPTVVEYLAARCRIGVRGLSAAHRLVCARCYVAPVGIAATLRRLDDGAVELVSPGRDAGLPPGQRMSEFLQAAAGTFGSAMSVVVMSGAEPLAIEALAQVRAAGGMVIAPPPDNCIVRGPVATAIEKNLVDEVMPISAMANWLQLRHGLEGKVPEA